MKHDAWVIGMGFLGRRVAMRLKRIDFKGIDLRQGQDAGQAGVLRELARQHGAPAHIYCCQATRGGSVADFEHAYHDVVRHALELEPEKLIFCSSASVLGARQGEICDENYPAQPRGERARCLWEAEQLVLAAGGVVARMPALYGIGRCELIRRWREGYIPVQGEPERQLNYLHVDDAADALLLLALRGRGLYHLVGESWSKASIMQQMAEKSGQEAPKTDYPLRPVSRGLSDYRLSSKRMKEELGWQAQRQLLSSRGL